MTSDKRIANRWFRVQPIGYVQRPGAPEPDPAAFYDTGTETALEILPRWADALDGIEGYSHLLVMFWLDRARRARKSKGRRPEGREEMPEVGLFATRTPRRPNPIGVSVPRLLRREGTTLWVTGIDAWPGTPILDIKGYTPRDDLRADATVPDWLAALWQAHDAERAGTG
jgi:tRNA-Thr(GGU) m(6)t(6)A37 methyltransferase TsaA